MFLSKFCQFAEKIVENILELLYIYTKLIYGGDKMTDLISLEDEFFTEESYKGYLEKEKERHNDKYREDGETIFDALASDEADFTKTPDGAKIITAVRSYE
jgi:hypothetical protein